MSSWGDSTPEMRVLPELTCAAVTLLIRISVPPESSFKAKELARISRTSAPAILDDWAVTPLTFTLVPPFPVLTERLLLLSPDQLLLPTFSDLALAFGAVIDVTPFWLANLRFLAASSSNTVSPTANRCALPYPAARSTVWSLSSAVASERYKFPTVIAPDFTAAACSSPNQRKSVPVPRIVPTIRGNSTRKSL